MKKKIEKIFGRYTRIVLQLCLVAACVGTIVYFMPRGKYKSHSFELGKAWEHEQIIADFDFVVKKSDKQIAEEKDSIRKHFRPYFKYDEKLNGSDFGKALPQSIIKEYVKRMNSLYKDGIISENDAKMLRNNNIDEIRFIYAGDTIIKDARILMTTSEAYETLLSADTILSHEAAEYLNLKSYIRPNYQCDTTLTDSELERRLSNLETRLGVVIKGQRIINKGDVIEKKEYRTLEVYYAQLQEMTKGKDNKLNVFMGQVIFIILCMLSLFVYIYMYRRDIAENSNKFTFTFLSVSVFPVIVGIITSSGEFSVFMLPYAMVPMMLCLFIDHSIAFITHCATIMMCSIMLGSPYEFVMLQFIAGYSAILSLKELSSRSQMFRCVIIILLTYAISYMCYELIIESSLSKMKLNMYKYFAISSLLMLLVYPIMFIVEKAFGFVSNVTLIELSNLNCSLLHRMSQEAPGTFQHSMQVGNLAAEAARALGANSLEVRTGALYHDIGKLGAPIYFTENQNGGINPHDKHQPEESATIIIKHVTDGLAIAEREHLPKKIKEFIATHHGVSKTGYFYITYKNNHPDEEVDEARFTYPGPRPTTKEQAILMMADCVEAASHSLKEYSENAIDALVDKIIDAKVADKELMMSPLTFQDINTVKDIFKKRLKAIYHSRISYPDEKKKQKA